MVDSVGMPTDGCCTPPSICLLILININTTTTTIVNYTKHYEIKNNEKIITF